MVKTVSELTKSVRNYYDKLFQDGFLVGVHVSKWGMSTSLEKDDLDYEGALPAIYKLGKKMLISEAILNEFVRLESKARRYLDANSYDFPIASAHFVPKKKVAVVLDTLDAYKKEYLALRDKFVENYETYKKDHLAANPDIEGLAEAYPDIKVISRKFDFTISLFEIQMPKEFGEIDIQSLITRDRAEAEIKAEMEERMRSHYESSLTKIETFTEDAAKVLRSQIVEACKTVIDKIGNKEVVSKRNIQMIRDEIENFKQLNVFDDAVVAAEIAKLEVVVTPNVNYKTDMEALEELSTALTGVMEKATNVSDLSQISGNYFRAIKL